MTMRILPWISVFIAAANCCLGLMGWSNPQTVFSEPGEDVSNPRFALHPTGGRAAIAWLQEAGGLHTVIGSAFDGGAWGEAVPLSGSSSQQQRLRVKIDGSGNAIAAWDFLDDDEFRVETAGMEMEGGGWFPGVALQVLSAAPYESFLNLVMNDDGYAVVSWQTPENALEAVTFDPFAHVWSANPYRLNGESVVVDPDYFSPTALDAQNNLYSLFIGPSQLWVSGVNALFPAAPKNELVFALDLGVASPSLAFSPMDNQSLAVLQLGSGFRNAIVSVKDVFSASGAFSVVAFPQAPVAEIETAMNASNGFGAAAWQLTNGVVQAAIFDGERWLPPITLTMEGSIPSLAINPTNNHVLVTWADATEGPANQVVQVAEYDLNNWSAPQSLSGTSSIVGSPKIAIGKKGFGVIAWHRLVGANTVIEAVISTN